MNPLSTPGLVASIALFVGSPSLLAGQADLDPAVAATTVSSISIRVETTLPGPPEWVYDQITGDVSEWWDHRFSEDPHQFVLEARPGGRFIEIFDETGDGVIHANVIWAQRGKRIRFEGPLGFAGEPIQIVTTYGFASVGADSTRLVVHVNAAGPLDDSKRRALRRVWDHFILARFKPYVEDQYGRHWP